MAWVLKNKNLQAYLDEQSEGNFSSKLNETVDEVLCAQPDAENPLITVIFGRWCGEDWRSYMFGFYFDEVEQTHTEDMSVYIAGDIMSSGSQYELEEIAKTVSAVGLEYYSPIKNKSINDKHSLTEEENNKLAERIVEADSERLEDSDIIIFNIKQHALGTLCELGQCYQMFRDSGGLCDKEFIFLYDDIRRGTNLNEKNDRRSWSINQYVYGLVLALSRGKGFIDPKDLKVELMEAVERVNEAKKQQFSLEMCACDDDDYLSDY